MRTPNASIAATASPQAPWRLLRAAWYLLCDAADTSQMLLISLLTGGAATAAGCAAASLVLWSVRAARGALVRAAGRRASANVGACRPMA